MRWLIRVLLKDLAENFLSLKFPPVAKESFDAN